MTLNKPILNRYMHISIATGRNYKHVTVFAPLMLFPGPKKKTNSQWSTYLHGNGSHIVKMQPSSFTATNHQMRFSPNKVNICCCLQPLQLRHCWRQPGGNAIFRQLLFPLATGKPTQGGNGEGLDARAGQSLVVASYTRPLFVHLTRGEQNLKKKKSHNHTCKMFLNVWPLRASQETGAGVLLVMARCLCQQPIRSSPSN